MEDDGGEYFYEGSTVYRFQVMYCTVGFYVITEHHFIAVTIIFICVYGNFNVY